MTAQPRKTPAAPDLAAEFVATLRRWLPPADFSEMQRRNEIENAPGVCCHSHDFCDANMAMDEAFRKLAGREVEFADDGDGGDIDLLNEAWTIAARGALRLTPRHDA